MVDQWWKTGGSDLDRFEYGYDRNSNRLYRKNTVALAASKYFDELYHAADVAANQEYDGLDRLIAFGRGELDSSDHRAIDAHDTSEQSFTLDQVGNWTTFVWDSTQGNVTQFRSHNTANEIYDGTYGDAITESAGLAWIDPKHDAAGNMTFAPRTRCLDWTDLSVRVDASGRMWYH